MMISRTVLVFAAFFAVLGTACAGGEGEISPEKAAKMMKQKNVVVLDVRTEDEFVQGHIKGAHNHDVLEDSFIKDVSSMKKNKTYIVYCLSGARSARAVQQMKDAGFTKVYNVTGGVRSWVDKGMPITQ